MTRWFDATDLRWRADRAGRGAGADRSPHPGRRALLRCGATGLWHRTMAVGLAAVAVATVEATKV